MHSGKAWVKFAYIPITLILTFAVVLITILAIHDSSSNSSILEKHNHIYLSRMELAIKPLAKQLKDVELVATQLQQNILNVISDDELLESAKRKKAMEISKDTLHSNFSIFGVYTIFESNKFGTDNKYISNANFGGNEIGRFTPYFTLTDSGRTNTTIEPESSFKFSYKNKLGMDNNHWYSCVFKERAACFIPPHEALVDNKNINLLSIALPIFSHDEVIGVVGVDIRLTNITRLVSLLSDIVFEGGAHLLLTEKNGAVIADSQLTLGNDVPFSRLSDSLQAYEKLIDKDISTSYFDTLNKDLYIQVPIQLMKEKTIFRMFAKIKTKLTIKERLLNINLKPRQLDQLAIYIIIEGLMITILIFIGFKLLNGLKLQLKRKKGR